MRVLCVLLFTWVLISLAEGCYYGPESRNPYTYDPYIPRHNYYGEYEDYGVEEEGRHDQRETEEFSGPEIIECFYDPSGFYDCKPIKSDVGY